MKNVRITEAELVGKGVIGLDTVPGLDVLSMQKKFDELVIDVVKPKHNALADAIEDGYATKNYVNQVVVDVGAGDMTKFTYDNNNDGIVDQASNADTLDSMHAEEFATAAQGMIAIGAMPKAGGEFSGDVCAVNDNRNTSSLRNSEIRAISETGELQSTNKLVFVRK